jgi:hypothetical protein
MVYLTLAIYVASHTFDFKGETPAFNFNLLSIAALSLNVCVAFIDSLAQGLTVVTTKIDLKIAKLKERRATATGAELMEDQTSSMKNYGLFNMLRGLMRTITALVGGILAKRIRVGYSYSLMCIYPMFMIVFTLFFFKETSVTELNLPSFYFLEAQVVE